MHGTHSFAPKHFHMRVDRRTRPSPAGIRRRLLILAPAKWDNKQIDADNNMCENVYLFTVDEQKQLKVCSCVCWSNHRLSDSPTGCNNHRPRMLTTNHRLNILILVYLPLAPESRCDLSISWERELETMGHYQRTMQIIQTSTYLLCLPRSTKSSLADDSRDRSFRISIQLAIDRKSDPLSVCWRHMVIETHANWFQCTNCIGAFKKLSTGPLFPFASVFISNRNKRCIRNEK